MTGETMTGDPTQADHALRAGLERDNRPRRVGAVPGCWVLSQTVRRQNMKSQNMESLSVLRFLAIGIHRRCHAPLHGRHGAGCV